MHPRTTLILLTIMMLLASFSIVFADIVPIKKPFKVDNHTLIKFHIKQNEGFETKVYKDTRGFLTVGYGHKLPTKGKYKIGDIVPQEQLDLWFQADYNNAYRCAIRFLKNNYLEKELIVATDMAFNLGCSGLNEFKLLRKHINNHDYTMATKAIKLSTYYKQVKNRADRNIKLLNR